MFWKGPLFTKDGFIDTCIDLETCEFINKEKEEDGILVPLFRNCHTHLGDTGARKSLPNNLSLAELVGPGEVKLNTWEDGIWNLWFLVTKMKDFR